MSAATPEKCRALLACVRPDAGAPGDRTLREAFHRLETDPGLKQSFDQQQEFDRDMGAAVRDIPLPPAFDAQLGASFARAFSEETSSRHLLAHPALWAALLSVLFLLGWGGLVLYQRMEGFPGDDAVNRLVTSVSANAGNQRLEPLSTQCDNLGDTLFLKYGLDDYSVPREFGRYEAVGYRVFFSNSFPVAQVKVREHGLTFLIFRCDQQGVDLKPPGNWKYLAGDQWAAAAQSSDNICFVVACHGDQSQLDAYLHEAQSADAARGQSASR